MENDNCSFAAETSATVPTDSFVSMLDALLEKAEEAAIAYERLQNQLSQAQEAIAQASDHIWAQGSHSHRDTCDPRKYSDCSACRMVVALDQQRREQK